MKSGVEQEAAMWLDQAVSDYSALEVLLKAGKYDLVCFLSEQVAEKAIKAFLISRGEEMIFSHSIAKLCEMCEQYDPQFAELKKKIKNLTPYYVEARYPNALEQVPAKYFDGDDAKAAIAMAKQALEAVKRKFRK